ncbi:MAG: hypothetical protein COA44_13680 [Arcobacter sp.]|nr:MAG: hypothetical protein COA44_13680 [Arcobacter sp.]
MKSFILFFSLILFIWAFDESEQIKVTHPLQDTKSTQKLLEAMQADIKVYLYQTPLSSYDYFDKNCAKLKSQVLITWIHGDIYLETLAAGETPDIRATLNKGQNTHLGDYRYDMFTLLSDLLLKMQEDSDFSGSKEKAILGTFVDGYFEKLQNQKLQCPCIDDALSNVKESDLLIQYTKVKDEKRFFNTRIKSLSKVSKNSTKNLKKEMNKYFSSFKFLPIKDIVMDEFGNYLLLCEGKTDKINDDIIFIVSANTVPVSYQVNAKMKNNYLKKSLLNKHEVMQSFNQTAYAAIVRVKGQSFFVNKLNPSLKLEPQSEKTRAYKKYASALGFMLAKFHSNPDLKSCKSFSNKLNKQVKTRVVKTELISMVYSYNETLEQNWEDFTDKEFLSVK